MKTIRPTPADPLYEIGFAAERMRAVRRAIDRAGGDTLLIALTHRHIVELKLAQDLAAPEMKRLDREVTLSLSHEVPLLTGQRLSGESGSNRESQQQRHCALPRISRGTRTHRTIEPRPVDKSVEA